MPTLKKKRFLHYGPNRCNYSTAWMSKLPSSSFGPLSAHSAHISLLGSVVGEDLSQPVANKLALMV